MKPLGFREPRPSTKYSKTLKSSDLSHPAFRSAEKTPNADSSSAVRVGEKGVSYVFENAPLEFQYSYTETPKVKPLGSKYSKTLKSSDLSHPAFRPVKKLQNADSSSAVRLGEKGVSYVFENAPFEFQYSYTETPKVRPLGFREPQYVPFGPSTMPRPWTGRAPLPGSKKKLPEFDSFKLPPPGKKGVKPVQKPGPFLRGSGPKYQARSREEVLGEELTEEEVRELVQGCLKTTRQLNIGRDGLTHNMLDNIHALWKRRRVCKIKCKGVCTVDMDNVRQQLEEKTGGKVIYSRGGVIFLFRGRNYNYKTHPRFPLMLWKPSAPIYPKLVPRVPEGLTLEEVTEMRKKGRELLPICKLGKNGVYLNLVKDVKEAFQECELVRVNCNGLNRSDCRKIGAKLKDLVPCVLISFEYEHILMWRGKDYISSPQPSEPAVNISVGSSLSSGDTIVIHQSSLQVSTSNLLEETARTPILEENTEEIENLSEIGNNHEILNNSYLVSNHVDIDHGNLVCGSQTEEEELVAEKNLTAMESVEVSTDGYSLIKQNGSMFKTSVILNSSKTRIDTLTDEQESITESRPIKENIQRKQDMLAGPCLDGLMLHLRQATENGSAIILQESDLDADVVYERVVALAKSAPSGPIFTHHTRKGKKQKVVKVHNKKIDQDVKVEAVALPEKLSSDKRRQKNQNKDNFKDDFPSIVPYGNLKIDELAKLLA